MSFINSRPVAVGVGAAVIVGLGAAGAVADGLIGSPDIRDGSVRSVDIKDETIKPRDIKNGAVTAAKIRDGSVGEAELSPALRGLLAKAGVAGPQGEKGDKGEKGDPGPAGPQGPAGHSGSTYPERFGVLDKDKVGAGTRKIPYMGEVFPSRELSAQSQKLLGALGDVDDEMAELTVTQVTVPRGTYLLNAQANVTEGDGRALYMFAVMMDDGDHSEDTTDDGLVSFFSPDWVFPGEFLAFPSGADTRTVSVDGPTTFTLLAAGLGDVLRIESDEPEKPSFKVEGSLSPVRISDAFDDRLQLLINPMFGGYL
ncbi:collagen-like triple helix repeat-containing protein [Nocardioides pakistanensis]